MKFRNLTENEIDIRVGQIGEGWCVPLLYKDARVDMNMLDETIGAEKWQRKHYELKGNIYCSVGILTDNGWIWKDDCGAESQTEKEKGEASDSFKRACVNWGIGRELYTHKVPLISVKTKLNKKGAIVLDGNLYVEKIKIENNIITGLSIKQERNLNRVYVYNKTSIIIEEN